MTRGLERLNIPPPVFLEEIPEARGVVIRRRHHAVVKRLRLLRQRANDGKSLWPWTLLNCRTSPCPPRHRPVTARSPPRCKAELTKAEALAAGHRADFEREVARS
jgi:hypothetical protein